MKRTGIIKNREQLHEACSSYSEGEGWHLKGQFFPEQNISLLEQTLEFNKEWAFCWSTVINGEYHFISEEAIIFNIDESHSK